MAKAARRRCIFTVAMRVSAGPRSNAWGGNKGEGKDKGKGKGKGKGKDGDTGGGGGVRLVCRSAFTWM